MGQSHKTTWLDTGHSDSRIFLSHLNTILQEAKPFILIGMLFMSIVMKKLLLLGK